MEYERKGRFKITLRILARVIEKMLPLMKMGDNVDEAGFRRKLGVRS